MSLSLFPSSSTSSSSSLLRRWRMPLVSVFPLPLPAARLLPRLALAAKRRSDLAGAGRLTNVGVKKTPSCCQVKEANLLFMIDSAILINRKKMCKFLKRCPESCGHVLVIAVSQAQHGGQELVRLKFRLQWAVVALCLAFRAAPEAEKFQSYVGLLLSTCTKCIGTNQQ